MHTRRLAPLFLAAALLAVAALAFVACNDDDDDNGDIAPTATAPAAESPTPGAATPTPAAEPDEPFQGARDPVEVTGDAAPPVAVLTDVRSASHEGYDRIVFEFSGAMPGYRVEYVDEAVGCGSGEPVEVAGTAYLQVKMQPAQAHDDAGNATVESQTIDVGLSSLVEATSTCDFEADVTWVLGLSEEVDFRVLALEDPFRVVVDVAQP
jgi:hypothetical protein